MQGDARPEGKPGPGPDVHRHLARDPGGGLGEETEGEGQAPPCWLWQGPARRRLGLALLMGS